jgi:hypothetical protein
LPLAHPDVRLAKYSDAKAYVIASVPGHMAAVARCQDRKPGEDVYFQGPSTGKVYGNYYAAGFRLARTVGDPAVLWMVWTKESGQWKVVSYFLMTP